MRLNFPQLLAAIICTIIIVLGSYATRIVGQDSKITIAFTAVADGTAATANLPARAAKLTPEITITLPGNWAGPDKVRVLLDGAPVGEAVSSASSSKATFQLKNFSPDVVHRLTVSYNNIPSDVFEFVLDQTPPQLRSPTARVIYDPSGEILVRVEFTELVKVASGVSAGSSAAGDIVSLALENPAKSFATSVALTAAKFRIDGATVEFNFGKIARANYQLTFPAAKIADRFDNNNAAPIVVGFLVEAAPITIPPQLELVSTSVTTAGGIKLVTSDAVKFNVLGTPDRIGTIRMRVNNFEQAVIATPIAKPIQVDAKLTTEGSNAVVVSYEDDQTGDLKTSAPFLVTLDSSGLDIERVEVVNIPTASGTGQQLLVNFVDTDFKTPVGRTPFELNYLGVNGAATRVDLQVDPIVDGRLLRFAVNSLPAGDYQLKVATTLQDAAGNPLGRRGALNPTGKEAIIRFNVASNRTFGQHVEFPPFTPPAPQLIPPEGFNPGDFVETRVARLFYYRDAHRVAQIINRNIRSYNQAAVTQAERRAENSRDDADVATDDRRASEREAVRAAEQSRQKEQELAAAKSALTEARQAQSSAAVEKANVDDLASLMATAPTEAQKAAIGAQLDIAKRRQAEENANLQRFGGTAGIDTLARNVAALEQTVAGYRQTELIREEQSQVAAAKEGRLRARQFRDEVTAAETDPDTYVAGDVHSVDPITQVSISVIGEGLIELRGPIKGINKIRTLINQIDSPVGQIKIGVFTIQINGEKGEKLERCVGEVENHVDLSRFLVNQSLNTLRRCVQAEAAMIAEQCAQETGHYQVDRDRRYLYAFFGRDFIDELYSMDSEFLKSQNAVLSLHAMDTISLNRALFIMALAKNDIRERIVARFLESAKSDLPHAEFDFRRSSELKPHVTEKKLPPWNRTHLPVNNHYNKEDLIYEAVQRNAMQRYHFRNFSSFFDLGFASPDTMNPMQREFIRMAQIFKARLVAEMELKQRVLERGLIEDRSNIEKVRFELLQPIQRQAIELEARIQSDRIASAGESAATLSVIQQVIQSIESTTDTTKQEQQRLDSLVKGKLSDKESNVREDVAKILDQWNQSYYAVLKNLDTIDLAPWRTDEVYSLTQRYRASIGNQLQRISNLVKSANYRTEFALARDIIDAEIKEVKQAGSDWTTAMTKLSGDWAKFGGLFAEYRHLIESPEGSLATVSDLYFRQKKLLSMMQNSCIASHVAMLLDNSYNGFVEESSACARLASIRKLERETRVDLDHRKLLNHLIDEQEEKFIELVEGTRSHIAVLDDYLKRLSIALEDDFKIQFYDPALIRVRESSRARQVTLSQIERTTILSNNRDFAKVDPQATMEFDLPKRQIAIKEAFDAARALVEDSGALMNDPTFLAAFQMMGGSKQGQTVKSLLPTQSSVNEQRDLGYADPLNPSGVPGSALQNLVPEPSVFKLETGTGFQLRPVMQPDGDSVVYDFDYMYTTNIREPVRADEKHIGRVKRHFVHTAVQTGNFEVREISRYQVALKLARTGQGVPLLQDIPVVGAAFRPAPSDESSIQQNIIFGQTNVYPTLYDLMGLRWAQQVVDLDHGSLLEAEYVIRGRQKAMKNYVFGEAARRVDDFLDVPNKTPNLYRTDFYHPQSLPSPHHPDGYSHPTGVKDPTGGNYERIDSRPADMQEPPYDRYRHRPAEPETIQLQNYSEPVRTAPVADPRSLQSSQRLSDDRTMRPSQTRTVGSPSRPLPVPPAVPPRMQQGTRQKAPY